MTIVRDVTVRYRAEEQLHKAQSELAQAGRMRALGEVAAGIAHEVNQPLAAIITNARAGQRGLDAVPPNSALVREALHDIVSDGKRASEVITRIRGLVNQEPMRRAPLAINDVIRDVAALSDRTLRQRHIELRLELAADLPRVRGDRIQLQQVLLNLVLNGADAMGSLNGRPRSARHLVVSAQRAGHRGCRGFGQRSLLDRAGAHFHAVLHDEAGGDGGRALDQPIDRRSPRRKPQADAQF